MGQALYRKYRPTSFNEAVGQDHITKTLKSAIDSGKISHAYLFTGPRGIGKTSIARILAHEVNNLPYNDDSIHLDIIEIDAASNRRIDEIRELRDKVHIAPTSAKYKVYIIDEVHMLTREAFNALLKTLEEPPAHCIFILATTEVHKLPETIISRTQRFSFSPVSNDVATKHLGSIAKAEKISISEPALKLLADHGEGSFRDSINLLDQLSTSGSKITEDTVRDTLGLPAKSSIDELLNSINNGSSAGVPSSLEMLSSQGVNPNAIAKELGIALRQRLMNNDFEPWIPGLLRQLLQVTASTNAEENLEIALLEVSAKKYTSGSNQVKGDEESSDENMPKPPKHSDSGHHEPKKESKLEKKSDKKAKAVVNFNLDKWPEIVTYAKSHAASLYTALRLAKPDFSDDILTLYFQFPLHQKKINQAHQKATVGQIIEEVSGAKVKVECVVNKEMFSDKKKIYQIEPAKPDKTPSPIKSISNIFGSAEMLS